MIEQISCRKFNGHRSFEFQTRNYITCFGYIYNHPHGQEKVFLWKVFLSKLKVCCFKRQFSNELRPKFF